MIYFILHEIQLLLRLYKNIVLHIPILDDIRRVPSESLEKCCLLLNS